MPLFLVDLYLDGYNTEEEMEAACEEFIKESLDFSASSINAVKINPLALVEGMHYSLGKEIVVEPVKVKKFIEKVENEYTISKSTEN